MKGALGYFIDLSHSINMQIANHCCTLLLRGDCELLVQMLQLPNIKNTNEQVDILNLIVQ